MEDVVDSAAIEAAERPPKRADVFRSYTGEALTLPEADALAGQNPLTVIVLAGPPAAGKTTLLAGIYEAFRAGPFAGFLFSGSRSLIGLEERCHLSRVVSGLYSPDTYHTPVDDPTSLVHLRLRREDLKSPASHLLFADLSGEHFVSLRDTGKAGRARPLFKSASDIAFLLDGSRLIDTRERFACLEDTKILLQVCLEKGLVDQWTRIQIVTTKWDLVLGSPDGRRAWIEHALEDLGRVVSTATLHRTALRSGNGVSRGLGLDTLILRWTASRMARFYLDPIQPPTPARQSHMFGR